MISGCVCGNCGRRRACRRSSWPDRLGSARERFIAGRLARVLGTSLDYLGGLENQKTIRIPNLPAYQEKSLLDFIEKFVDEPRKDGNLIDYT